MKYFLLHDFIYGWDVSHFTETDGQRHVVLMDTKKEAEIELEDVKDESELWKIEEGYYDEKSNKIITKNGMSYDYFTE